jgi:hypothetical protein
MLSSSGSSVDRGLGRSRPSTADRAADTAVDHTVDHGPRVHREPAKGVRPELICAVDRVMDGCRCCRGRGPRRGRGLRVHGAPVEGVSL